MGKDFGIDAHCKIQVEHGAHASKFGSFVRSDGCGWYRGGKVDGFVQVFTVQCTDIGNPILW
jgi:hypothetical protein